MVTDDTIPLMGFPDEETPEKEIYTCKPAPGVRAFVWMKYSYDPANEPIELEVMDDAPGASPGELFNSKIGLCRTIKASDPLTVAACLHQLVKDFQAGMRGETQT